MFFDLAAPSVFLRTIKEKTGATGGCLDVSGIDWVQFHYILDFLVECLLEATKPNLSD